MAEFTVQMANNARAVVAMLNQGNIESHVKTSRYHTNIKAVEVNSSIDLGSLLASVGIQGKIEDLSREDELSVSGKYKAKLVTLEKGSGILPKGSQFYLVNTYSERGTLKSKALAPEKLGLTKTTYKSVTTFDGAVLDAISALKVETDIKKAMTEMYSLVQANQLAFSKPLQELMTKIRPNDVQVIGKDYGEILSMRWLLGQTSNIASFNFSPSIQTALYDFAITSTPSPGVTVENLYSAKFQEGGAPSIKSIVGELDSIYKTPTRNQATALNVLKILGSKERTITSLRILNVAKQLNLVGYSQLKSILGEEPTVDSLKKFVGTIAKSQKTTNERVKKFKEAFDPFYTAINKKATDESLKLIFANTTYPKFHSPVVSPLGYRLVEYLNATPIYQEMLNNAARQLTVKQIYLDFDRTGMSFQERMFEGGIFKFEYGSNAKDSDNTGIKFSMIKKR